MPRRPRSHCLEDEARDHVKRVFHDVGWTCEDLHKDYGEDLLVRIFMDEKATPLSFFIQSKGTDDIEKYRRGKYHFRYRVTREHVMHWAKFCEPIILALFDASSGKTYWEQVQYFVESEQGEERFQRETKSVSIDIPTGNVLDEEGVHRIRNLTRRRYRRSRYQKAGSEVLLELLETRAGIRIKDYSPENEVLILATEEGGAELIYFGDLAEVVDLRCQLEDTTPKDIVLNDTGEVLGTHSDRQSWHFLQRKNSEMKDVEDVLPILRKGVLIKEVLQELRVIASQMKVNSPEEVQSEFSDVEMQLSEVEAMLKG